ncbi:unnamed protein product [Calypogeia fissa]
MADKAVVDEAFKGAGKAAGMEIWRIEDFKPVPLPKSDYGTFYNGDSYIVLKTTKTDSGSLNYDLHFWLGKNTSQDESGTAAIMTVELDQYLGDKAIQYRELQGHESELFLSYFKPCIVPKEGGAASGFRKVEAEVFDSKMFVVKGTGMAVRVTEVPVSRDSLNHDDIFILDTQDNIFQFNGAKASIGEKGKAMSVVQQLKDNNHEGSVDVVIIHDGEEEGGNSQFWSLLGGFGPLGENSYTHTVQNQIKTPSGR